MPDLRKILDALPLSPTVDGDDLYFPTEEEFLLHADMNGRPFEFPGVSRQQPTKGIINDYDDLAFQRVQHLRKTDPDAFLRAYFQDSTAVLTSYLNSSEQWRPKMPALMWETLIYFEDGTTWQARYYTKAAAHQSHAMIVKAFEKAGLRAVAREKGVMK